MKNLPTVEANMISSKSNDGRVAAIVQNIVRKELFVKAIIKDIQDVVVDDKDLDRLHRQVQKTLNEIRTALEELTSLAREQEREAEREAIMSDVREHLQQVSSLQQSLRRANLAAQVSIEKTSRYSLMTNVSTEGSLSTTRQRFEHKDKEKLAKMSTNITDDLLSISRALSSQVKLSEEALHTLVSSTKVVGDTQEEFKAMGGVIHQSRKLLSKYNRREFTDKVLIFLALVFFFACALYVMSKRAF